MWCMVSGAFGEWCVMQSVDCGCHCVVSYNSVCGMVYKQVMCDGHCIFKI